MLYIKNYFTPKFTVHIKCNTKQSWDLYLQRCHSSLAKRLIKFKASQLWNYYQMR